MIDFTKTLPKAVTVNGRDFFIKTDFRVWINFGKKLEENGLDKMYFDDIVPVIDDTAYGNMPYQDELGLLLAELIKFYADKNTCPLNTGNDAEKVLDYMIDSDYIYAGFLEQYGIDLVDIEYLHWHKFLALMRSLSDDTMLGKIMTYRGYKSEKNTTYEKQMAKLKAIWALPIKHTEEEKHLIDEFDDYFS